MKYLTLLSFLFFALALQAQTEKGYETTAFKVYGNCSMCEKRIENALFVTGVRLADWDVKTHILTVTYKPSRITLQEIHEKVAAVGHDTDLVKAKDDVYENLHACCHYDRPKS